MPDLVHDPRGEHLKPRYRTLLGLGLAVTVVLTVPVFLYAADLLARALGIDAHAPLWRQTRSELWFLLVIATAMVWIAACFVGYKTILLTVLRAKGVIPPEAGWFSNAAQAVIGSLEVDGKLPPAAMAIVLLSLLTVMLAGVWLSIVVVAIVSCARRAHRRGNRCARRARPLSRVLEDEADRLRCRRKRVGLAFSSSGAADTRPRGETRARAAARPPARA